ncbi:alpha/beta fold hydrolase [Jatrophihabitans sp. YIM 134969]
MTDHPGAEPALVLMHGYPDDSRIHDRLVPHLAPRRVVTFDFLGHGRSGRGVTSTLAPGQRESELAAVVRDLDLDRPVVVGHDASGPVAVHHTLDHPDQVGGLVLLDTYYGRSPALRFPEFIRLLADPHFRPLVDAVLADASVLGWMLLYTDAQLREGPADPAGVGVTAVIPQFFGDAGHPDARAAIRAWTGELFTDLALQDARVAAGDLAAVEVPVTVAAGAHDPCFGAGVTEHLQSLFPHASRHEVPGAAHWPQWDRPDALAPLLLEAGGRV